MVVSCPSCFGPARNSNPAPLEPSHHRTHAFSLVEILVVIGIVALLLGILLPTLSRAREAANRTECMSNLRQIGMAFTLYLSDNNGRFPRPAQAGDQNLWLPEDWVHFQPGRDASQGAVAKYTSKPFNPEMLRCPTDDVATHRTSVYGGIPQKYPYSYTVNEQICRIKWNGPTLRLNQIRNHSEKILIVEEAANTIDDGCWAWQGGHPPGQGANVMSNRHDRKSERIQDPKFGRGNVAYVDGHVSYIQRKDSFDPRHYDPHFR